MTTNTESKPTELYLKGGSTGVLLIHGFTGSSTEMSLVGDFLHQRGFTILALLLPGHGTSPEDLNRKRWTDWVGHTEQALERMHAECSTVFVGGLSLGALLSLYVAGRDDRIDGVIAYSPPIMMAHPRSYLMPLKYLLASLPKPKDYFDDPNAKARLWNYSASPLRAYHELLKFMKVVRSNLDRVHCPVLVVHSTSDPIIHRRSAMATLDGVGSKDTELLTLHKCGHVITLDSEWEHVARETVGFIERHSRAKA